MAYNGPGNQACLTAGSVSPCRDTNNGPAWPQPAPLYHRHPGHAQDAILGTRAYSPGRVMAALRRLTSPLAELEACA
jgi:hypothetical protein